MLPDYYNIVVSRDVVQYLVRQADNLDVGLPGARSEVFRTETAAGARYKQALATGEVVKLSV